MVAEVIFVCGPHCAGKSTLLEGLERSGRISFRGPEIGRGLYLQRGVATDALGRDFEREVTRLELERDRNLAANLRGIAFLETWHPGNLAYAFVRNPAMVDELVRKMRSSPLIGSIRGIRLRIPVAEIRHRTRQFRNDEEWAVEFYSRIDEALGTCLDLLSLRERTVEVDASAGPAEVLAEVERIMAAKPVASGGGGREDGGNPQRKAVGT